MENTIISQIGTSFDIILESAVGSTGFGWCLKSIPAGVELMAIDHVPIKPILPGSGVRQIFTFVAVNPLKEGVIEFDLLRLTHPHCQIADSATYHIVVHDDDENDALKNEIGGQKFLRGSGAMVHARPIPPYGFADSEKAILLYGFPPSPLYGYPPADCGPSVIESKTNCMLKYGNPFGVAIDAAECNLKYGYPLMKYGYPPIYKYGFPMSNASGEVLTVKEDPKNCIVKYGTPGGVANTPGDCRLKYGFPVQK
jgi:hypothetical protein